MRAGAILIRTGRRRICTWFRCVATSVAGSCATSCGVGVAGDAERGAGVALHVPAFCGAFRRAQGRKHGIASVLCVILLARLANWHGAVAAARYAKAMTQKDLAQRGRTRTPAGMNRYPNRPCTGCCRTPTRRGSRRRCGAQPRLRVGHAVDGKRGRTGKDHYETVSLARDRHSILNYHDGEIAAVHAATAPVAGRLLTLDALHTTRETARLIVETHGADWMMTVKGNAPKTFETFESIHWESTGRYRETPTHGRIEQRSIEVFTPPAKMIN